jgi:hypothetical protein
VNKRRENTAKYIYDISKLLFAVLFLGSLAKGKFDTMIVVGAISAIVTFLIANRIDSAEVSDARH